MIHLLDVSFSEHAPYFGHMSLRDSFIIHESIHVPTTREDHQPVHPLLIIYDPDLLPAPKPFHIYIRRPRSDPPPTSSPVPSLTQDLDPPPADPQYASYQGLTRALLIATSSISIPHSVSGDLDNQNWVTTMQCEMDALHQKGTDSFASREENCKWVFNVKFLSGGTVDKYKVSLVVKGFT